MYLSISLNTILINIIKNETLKNINNNIITEVENIYGVSMQDGISKVVSLKI